MGLLAPAPAAAQFVELLSQRLWSPRDAYDAAHVLMVPMHAAYRAGDEAVIAAMQSFVQAYMDDLDRPKLGRLTELQFHYLLSQYLLLEARAGRCSQGRDLADFLTHETWLILHSPAWQWQRGPFATMFDRLEWKLAAEDEQPSYLGALIDEELFALAISADLVSVGRRCQWHAPYSFREAMLLVYRILLQEGQFEGDRWQLQPGVWRDHPDYRFAGHDELAPNLEPKPVEDIGMDSSHATRLPLMLRSFGCAALPDSVTRTLAFSALRGLRRQFLDVVVIDAPGAVRQRNFMSGHDGIYRYSYATVGSGGGYEPSGVSFTFNLGWWAFLGGSDVADLYRRQIDSLPFSSEILDLYEQPVIADGTAPRPRHPEFRTAAFLRGDLIRKVLEAAERLASTGVRCGDERPL